MENHTSLNDLIPENEKPKPVDVKKEKAERLDRFEKSMEGFEKSMECLQKASSKLAESMAEMKKAGARVEAGLLLLLNMLAWNNATITPIGTHDPAVNSAEFKTLEEALVVDGDEQALAGN